MHDACDMNFVIDLAHRRVSVAQRLSIGARNPKVWVLIPQGGLRIFFFVPRSRQDEKHLSLYLNRAQNLPSLLFYLMTIINFQHFIGVDQFTAFTSYGEQKLHLPLSGLQQPEQLVNKIFFSWSFFYYSGESFFPITHLGPRTVQRFVR